MHRWVAPEENSALKDIWRRQPQQQRLKLYDGLWGFGLPTFDAGVEYRSSHHTEALEKGALSSEGPHYCWGASEGLNSNR